MTNIVRGFVRGVRNHPVSRLGAWITALLFPVLVIYSLLDVLELVDHPRLSFIVYGGLTWLFIVGHLMVFLGLFVLQNKHGATLFSAEEFKDQFSESKRFGSIRKLILFVTAITLFNLVVISVSAYNGFMYSESTDFCGKLCHSVMTPELTAYDNSPHSRVECVECHIGSGATWFVRSKLSGIKQFAAVILDTYSQPIETPIHGLRPARQTCEECHRPELFHGDRLRVKDHFLHDEGNTHVRTVLLMKVGSGDEFNQNAQGSHWHVARSPKILYEHADRKRLDITRVRLVDRNGSETVFTVDGSDPGPASADEASVRLMDCLDCHNRPTHVYLTAEEALDRKLFEGTIPSDLPYIKKQGMALIQAEYDSQEQAARTISRELRTWYAGNYPEWADGQREQLEAAVAGVVSAYTENVFPEMKIGFGTYERHLGHWQSAGCFRCHGVLRSDDGRVVSQDCELCHEILADEEPVVAEFPTRQVHRFVRSAKSSSATLRIP